jgi:hypothetical protein
MSLKKECSDCSVETDTEYCEICNGWVCEDCDERHDCLAQELLSEAELEAALDEMIDTLDEDDNGNGHA